MKMTSSGCESELCDTHSYFKANEKEIPPSHGVSSGLQIDQEKI